MLLLALASLCASAVCFWFGTGLHPIWWLTWLAPLPVLWSAARLPERMALALAFAAWAIGATNEWGYFRDFIEIPLPLSILQIFVPASLFALDVGLWRRLLLRGKPASAALAFASFWVVFEFALQRFSPHSTFGDLAYSQMDCLPILQLASVAGLSGIDFLLFFTPASLATLSIKPRKGALRVVAAALVLMLVSVTWGGGRLKAQAPAAPKVRVALIANDDPRFIFPPEGLQRDSLFGTFALYGGGINAALDQGAKLIVLPEKLARTSTKARARFTDVAKQHGATIAFGLETADGGREYNEAVIHAPQAELIYRKEHMVPGFEGHLTPGTELVTLDTDSGKWGFEICKDLDFPALSRRYGQQGVGLMVVPAWDFIVDGWLHDRMAVARGVENGFTVVRAAKQGLLTVSDSRGVVLAERSSREGLFSKLAEAPVHHVETFYTKWGDWFAWLNVVSLSAILLVTSGFVIRRKQL